MRRPGPRQKRHTGSAGELPDDLTATLGCIRALGAAAVFRDDTLEITGINAKPDVLRLDCRDSGATYRLLYPVAPLIGGRAEFMLSPSLAARPMEPVTELLKSKGVAAEKLSVSGSFGPGEFPIRGDVSSQYISGLLLALSLLEGESRIRLTTPLQSKSYVELTRASLSAFGGESQWMGQDTILVKPRRLKAADVTVEGDYTHASLFLAAGAVYGPVTVTGLDPGSIQGDRAMLSILDRMGARVDMGGGSVTVSPGPASRYRRRRIRHSGSCPRHSAGGSGGRRQHRGQKRRAAALQGVRQDKRHRNRA